MEHENARNGIGKVFAAEIIQIISVACMLLAFIPKTGLAMGTSISGILMIISFILMLVGLNKAGKDNARLKKAFICFVVTVIISLLLAVLSSVAKATWVSQMGQIITAIISLIATYNVLMGCAELNTNLAKKAQSTWKLYVTVVIIDIVLTVVGITLGVMGMTDMSLALTIAWVVLDMILDLITYIKYLGFLNTARQEL
ncbi:MAG: hypothetical protein K5644_01980 [Lachnospiraceae bacterium]|nr:hypothetical protein [Lachnospiraceae bacterium]